jgi:hypothetical protein
VRNQPRQLGLGCADLAVQVDQQRHIGGQHTAGHRGVSGRQRLACGGHQTLGHRPTQLDIAGGRKADQSAHAQCAQPGGVGEFDDDQPTDLGAQHIR